MQPHQIAKETESSQQQALFCWAALNTERFPELRWLHHIPNGGARGDNERSNMIRGAKLKAEGVKEGIPDVFLPVAKGGFHGLYIEMKKPKLRPVRAGSKGGLSDEQLKFKEFAHKQGFGWVVCYDWQEASEIIEQYLLQ